MRAIITGGSDGLGLEISKQLLDKGYEVICLSRRKPKIPSIHIPTDLTKIEDIENTIEVIKSKYSYFDILINCAGILQEEEFGQIDYKNLETLYKVNVLAPIIITSMLLENIKQNEADIINIGSSSGYKEHLDWCAYSSSKRAMRGVDKNFQLELKNTKSRVIGFHPGGFQTKLFDKAGVDRDSSKDMKPADLAKLVIHIFELPKNMEVSEIIINRKK